VFVGVAAELVVDEVDVVFVLLAEVLVLLIEDLRVEDLLLETRLALEVERAVELFLVVVTLPEE
jgi:hypothetical protein